VNKHFIDGFEKQAGLIGSAGQLGVIKSPLQAGAGRVKSFLQNKQKGISSMSAGNTSAGKGLGFK